MDEESPATLSAADVAQRLGVKPRAVYRYIKAGLLRGRYEWRGIQRVLRIEVTEVARFERERGQHNEGGA